LVAYPDERTIFMERIWSDRRRGYGLGLQSFYWQISLSHLNIQKRYTDEFLTGKGDYQIQKTPKTKVIKPIKSNAVNERWGMDLIDMSIQNTHRYIMSVVDNFSGYLFTRRLNNRNAATIRDALQNIINTPLPNGSGGTYPHIMQSDNGGEFDNATMTAFLQANNIRRILSTSYHPRSNGKVERFNREIRKKIKAGFIRQNANNWTAAMLQEFTENINSQPNHLSKLRAVDIYRAGYQQPQGPLPAAQPLTNASTLADKDVHIRHYQNTRVARLTAGALPRFQVGDLVRVHLFALSSTYRRKIKDHDGTNKFAVNWSPVISRVLQVFAPNTTDRPREMYSITVGDVNGLPPPANQNVPLMRGAVPWLFAGNEITLAGNTTSVAPRTIPRSDLMNSRN
jgi:transposase InsO family protein